MEEAWPTEWLRGVLELGVLRVLTEGAEYGYAIITRLEAEGFGTIKGGTLYPLLTRLEQAGMVVTEWRAGQGGPGRKYFALTAAGHLHFQQESARWNAFTRRTQPFICQETP
ncbi:PadR family transcriptional regulator [Luteococcus peritonei]|uniref:PadR family transcriptional regulator n=1 Tax=Luteococcus peritonei TaxID=88874 RepID=A0ABW4RS69_9ACTN